MTKISESFTVAQPADKVWAFFQDVPQVVHCLPGLELTDQSSDNVYRGRIKIKLGAVTSAFEGEAAILETDNDNRASRISGKGVDKKGGSRARAEFGYRVVEIESGAEVIIDADIKLTGTLAQMGRTGIVTDVVRELTKEFAANLKTKLAAAEVNGQDSVEAAPISDALSGEKLLMAFVRGRWRALTSWIFGLMGR